MRGDAVSTRRSSGCSPWADLRLPTAGKGVYCTRLQDKAHPVLPSTAYSPHDLVAALPLTRFITLQETQRLIADSPPGISAVPHDDNLRYFDVLISGPEGSPFEGAPGVVRHACTRAQERELTILPITSRRSLQARALPP